MTLYTISGVVAVFKWRKCVIMLRIFVTTLALSHIFDERLPTRSMRQVKLFSHNDKSSTPKHPSPKYTRLQYLNDIIHHKWSGCGFQMEEMCHYVTDICYHFGAFSHFRRAITNEEYETS